MFRDRHDIRIALIYLGISIFWILFSDEIMFTLFPDMERVYIVGLIKGLGFVTVSGILLYWLLHRELVIRRARDAKLRTLAARLDEVREEERKRLSREIHDGLGQLLTGMNIDVSILKRQLLAGDGKDGSAVDETVSSIDRLLGEILGQTRDLARRLRPALLDELGFAEAIQAFMKEFEQRSGMDCKVRLPGGVPVLSQRQQLAIYRIIQEAVTNVARHAQADSIELNLEIAGDLLVLEIRDNGTGVRPADLDKKDSLGIVGMSERAELLDGFCRVFPREGGGTVVHVEFPWRLRRDESEGG